MVCKCGRKKFVKWMGKKLRRVALCSGCEKKEVECPCVKPGEAQPIKEVGQKETIWTPYSD